MRTIFLLSAICFLSCALSGPIPPPDTHRNCCYDLQRLRESDARAHVIAEELITKNNLLTDEVRYWKAQFEAATLTGE